MGKGKGKEEGLHEEIRESFLRFVGPIAKKVGANSSSLLL